MIAHGSSSDVEFQSVLRGDLVMGTVLADFGFGTLSRRGLTGGPHLYGGFALGLGQDRYLVYDSDAVSDGGYPTRKTDVVSRYATGGIALGAGVDFWVHGVAGVRVRWLNQMRGEDIPQYDPTTPAVGRQLRQFQTLTVDVVVAL